MNFNLFNKYLLREGISTTTTTSNASALAVVVATAHFKLENI